MRITAVFLVLFGFTGCATYQGKVSLARDLLKSGQTAEAVEKLKPLAATDNGDQLIYLLDYATALQIQGSFQESNKAYLAADRLSDELDYHSVSRVAGSLLTNEEMKQYKGDTFEKIFINAQLALNYLALGELDDALVEARRINEKYLKYRSDEKKDFELNPFAKYLSALVWEADRKYDDAAIAYAEAYKISPRISSIHEDLIRSSKLARRDQEYQKWKKAFPDVVEKPEWYDKGRGELIIIVQQGWGPRKAFNPGDSRFPVLDPVFNQTQRARLNVNGVGMQESVFIYDVQGAAIQTLNDDMGALVARRLTGIVAKELAAEELRKKNELLGAVAWIAMHASDRADLRQWSTLPQTIQVIRMPLKPGTYSIDLQGLTDDGSLTSDHLEVPSVNVKAGRKVFFNWRTLH